MQGGGQPRLPRMDDLRLIQAGPELTMEYLTVYEISHRHNPRGILPEPDAISVILCGDTSLGEYYTDTLRDLIRFNLIGFDPDGRYAVIDYERWNPEWDDTAARMRASRQRKATQGELSGIPSKAKRTEPLNAVQLARFALVKTKYHTVAGSQKIGALYPAKVAFAKLNPDDEEIRDILAGIDAWGRTEMWIADRGIPYLVTFLNKRYWEEPPAPADTMYPVKVNGHKPDNADITRAGLAALTERYRERG
jgi:hypothetical protein